MAIINEHAVKAAWGVMFLVSGEPVLRRENQAALFGDRDTRRSAAIKLAIISAVPFASLFMVA